MFEMKIEITNETGIHARPASLFVNETKKYKSNITLIKGDKSMNAKSILGVLALGLNKGSELILRAEGEDEEVAVKGLAEFINNLEG